VVQNVKEIAADTFIIALFVQQLLGVEGRQRRGRPVQAEKGGGDAETAAQVPIPGIIIPGQLRDFHQVGGRKAKGKVGPDPELLTQESLASLGSVIPMGLLEQAYRLQKGEAAGVGE
jgi:hypothetical protein